MKILFIIRKARINAKGECPLVCRLTIEGLQATPFSTGIFVSPKKWSAKTQRSIDPVVMQELSRIRAALSDIFFQERAIRKIITPDHILSIYRSGRPEPITWKGSIANYVENLKGKKRAPTTISMYTRHITRFSDWSESNPIAIERRDIALYYEKLLATGYCRDYCNKTIQAIYGFFRFLVKRGAIQNNPCQGVDMEWENIEDTTYLTEEEIDSITKKEWSPRAQRIVDSFIFMCFSGMHVGDYLRIAPEWIKTEQTLVSPGSLISVYDGSKDKPSSYIEYNRGKNGQLAQVPIGSTLAGLILKYGGVDKLPKPPAQKINDMLKVIAERCRIRKKLTCKIARKTFTDMCLNKRSMQAEVVATMLGHAGTGYIRKYGRIRPERAMKDWRD